LVIVYKLHNNQEKKTKSGRGNNATKPKFPARRGEKRKGFKHKKGD